MKVWVCAILVSLSLVAPSMGQDQESGRAPRPERGERRSRRQGPTPESRAMRARVSETTVKINEAIEAGNIEAVRALLGEDPAGANGVDRVGFTPLYMAARGGHKEIAEMLLASGAEVDGEFGALLATPLESAATRGQLPLVQLLVARGANVNHQNKRGETPLAGAAENGYVKVIEFLLANKADINLADKEGETPLDEAEKNKKLEASDLLFARGGTGKLVGRQAVQLAASGDLVTLKKLLAANPSLANAADGSGMTPLHVAPTRPVAEALLAAGAKVEPKTMKRSPLFVAVEDGRNEVALVLIEKGADVNAMTASEKLKMTYVTPLLMSAAKGDLPLVTALVANKAEINYTDLKDQTALDMAEAGKHVAVAAFLKKNGGVRGLAMKEAASAIEGTGDLPALKKLIEANPSLIHAKVAGKYTPILLASFKGKRDIVEWLLANKANINDRNAGHNAIGWANQGGHKDLAAFLTQCAEEHAPYPELVFNAVEAGDLVKVKKYLAIDPALLNQPFASWSPLQIAIRKKQKAMVDFLLASKADVNSVDDNQETPLHEAGSKGDPEIVDKLLARGAQLNAKNKFENTPLDAAVNYGNSQVASHLRAKGAKGKLSSHEVFQAAADGNLAKLKELIAADPSLANFRSQTGWTPLGKACVEGQKEAVTFLLSKGADPNAADKDGFTPLMGATSQKRTEIVAMLLAKGANARAQDADGFGVLHTAIREIAAMLVEHGADVNVKTANGRTPLHLAANRGDMETVEFLVSKNAEINPRTQKGETPLDWASSIGFFDNDQSKAANARIIAFLRGRGGKLGREM